MAALLLDTANGITELHKVEEYYEINLRHSGNHISGAETFSSLPGLAKDHSASALKSDDNNSEDAKGTWEEKRREDPRRSEILQTKHWQKGIDSRAGG